ncbi:MAG TPA: YggT family protein [Anaerolineae bacterium]|nr:YggT family protein [Anaerolineae bacterium]MCB0222477.1 YggT family protein [Anaerolineae bacterium]MCB9108936.1 YggT family protein [Anaerolineales bacterium]HRV95817.1 YggT family protein [Anaerolineae bacterium]
MGNFLIIVIQLIFELLWWAILIKVILSWLPMAGIRIDPYNPVVQMLNSITDPILEPLRRYTTIGMIDLSPIVALIGLRLIERFLIGLLGG